MNPPESFIQFLWMNKKIPAIGLTSASGSNIKIVDYGQLNTVGGPDIFNAKIKIDETLWVGNVEFHSRSSDWYKHNHETDSAYNNIILHIVFEDDREVEIKGNLVETLVIPPSIRNSYPSKIIQLEASGDAGLMCKNMLSDIDSIILENWKTRLLIERIENKLGDINATDVFNYTWKMLMVTFGVKYNKVPMRMIANSIDFRSLRDLSKNGLDRMFLEKSQLKLPVDIFLPKENNTNDTPLEWKFGGIRPANQPMIKLMQFSSFFSLSKNDVIGLLLELNFDALFELVDQIEIHSYWHTHMSFDSKKVNRKINIGKVFKNHLLLNALLPLSFHLNKTLSKKDVSDKILEFYENIPKENNRITKFMTKNGFKNENGFDSQSLIHLNNYYCQTKKCLNCAIGVKIVNENNSENTVLL